MDGKENLALKSSGSTFLSSVVHYDTKISRLVLSMMPIHFVSENFWLQLRISTCEIKESENTYSRAVGLHIYQIHH
jgi:hypothetical protein